MRACGRARRAADAAALGPPAPVPPPRPTDVTRLVRHARRQARLSQRGLAARAGVAQSTIAEIEMGRVDPKAGTLAKLLAACDCQLAALPAGPATPAERASQAGYTPSADDMAPVDTTPAAGTDAGADAGSGSGSGSASGSGSGSASASRSGSSDGAPQPRDPAGLALALDRRLQREPQQRVDDAGPAASSLVSGICAAVYATRAAPIIIGELAELVWGADRRPAIAQLCARPEDCESLAAALTGGGGPPYDVQLAPPGTSGWADLRRAAAQVWFDGGKLLVASLDDLLRIRRARRAPGDDEAIRELESLVVAVEQTERAEAAANPRYPAHWDVGPLAHLDWLLLRGRVRKVDRERRQRTLTGFCS